jgi:hypothetical protein
LYINDVMIITENFAKHKPLQKKQNARDSAAAAASPCCLLPSSPLISSAAALCADSMAN